MNSRFEDIPDAVYLPPASQGDIYRIAQRRPRAIGIIDGLFDGVPSIWHKEILWALSQGIHVLGAASMGALRAAELAPFGMVGIGRIFEAFRDGALEDDDEVAVLHAGSDLDYTALTTAMVDIRRLVADATVRQIISVDVGRAIIAAAKNRHFRDRIIPDVLAEVARDGSQQEQIVTMAEWLKTTHVSQKREDASELLNVLRENQALYRKPFAAPFRFQYTTLWHDFTVKAANPLKSTDALGARVDFQDILDELRLQGSAEAMISDAAFRFMAADECERLSVKIGEEELSRCVDRFRRERGLVEATKFKAWMQDNELLDRGGLLAFLLGQAKLYISTDRNVTSAQAHLLDALRSAGLFSAAVQRAKAKRGLLGDDSRGFDDDEERAALDWYSNTCEAGRQRLRGRSDSFAGFDSREDFTRAVVREYRFNQINLELHESQRFSSDEFRPSNPDMKA